jgi:hypothetical protein
MRSGAPRAMRCDMVVGVRSLVQGLELWHQRERVWRTWDPCWQRRFVEMNGHHGWIGSEEDEVRR